MNRITINNVNDYLNKKCLLRNNKGYLVGIIVGTYTNGVDCWVHFSYKDYVYKGKITDTNSSLYSFDDMLEVLYD